MNSPNVKKKKSQKRECWRSQLKAFLATISNQKGGMSLMAYAEKKVNWKNNFGRSFYEK